ncbi:MAG: Gfo/Idh/MocA family oxidoreductase [Bacteroidota bacterium]
MKVLIIGLGSIARRHILALRKLDPQVEILALRSNPSASQQEDITNLFDWQDIPTDLDFILISNPTSAHFSTIQKCITFQVPLFIEKPPLMHLEGAKELVRTTEEASIRTYTAFNMRFHPVLQWLKANLPVAEVLETRAYCGSYLPDWRPDTDYTKSYSASAELGGGVHLDLIHEMDYVNWLFGNPDSVRGVIDKISDLEITSTDYAHYQLFYKKMNATISLNYFRRDTKRSIEIVLKEGTWCADLIQNTVTENHQKVLFSAPVDVQKMYNDQMAYFVKNLNASGPFMNELAQSLRTLDYALKIDNRYAGK